MEIFKLFGSILIKSDEAEKSIGKTEKQAGGLAAKLGSGIKTAAKWGAALGTAAVAAGGAMVAVANKAAVAADEVDKASRRAGTDAETWQKLKYAFGQSGIEAEKLEKTMVRNQKSLNEAASGSKKAADAYKDLKVSIKNSDGSLRDADSVYQDTLKSLADMTDLNERNRIANDLFGKSYSDLAPILDSGSAGIDDLTKRAKDLGLVMSQDSVDAGVKFGDTMDDVKQVGGALMNNIALKLMPTAQKILDWIIEKSPVITEAVGKAVDFISAGVEKVATWFKENGESIKSVISTVVKVAKVLIEGAFKVISGLFDFFAGIFEGDADKMFGGIVKIIEGFAKVFVKLGKMLFGGLWDGIKSVWDGIKKWVSDKIAWVADVFSFGKKKDKKDPKESSPDGYHASGLPYVPYDGYKAVLHKGERIVRAGDNAISEMRHSGTIRVEGVNSKNELVAVSDYAVEEAMVRVLKRQVRLT